MEKDDDSDVEAQLTQDYDPVEVETSITLNKEVREWNENKEQLRHCLLPVLRTVLSVAAHIGFLGCVGLVAWSTQSRLHADTTDSQPDYILCYIISSVVAGVLYIGILAEAAACETCSYLRNQARDISAEQYLERTRDACPMVRWRTVSYHYEAPGQGHDAKTKNVNNMRHKEKVVSYEDTEAFHFNKWRDLTRDIKGLFRLPIIRLECSKIFIFRDENTKDSYMHQYVYFRERSRRRDEFMEHDEVFTITGFGERLVLCTDGTSRPCWLSQRLFWLMTILLLTWPYRLFFFRRTTKVYVVFIKELEA